VREGGGQGGQLPALLGAEGGAGHRLQHPEPVAAVADRGEQPVATLPATSICSHTAKARPATVESTGSGSRSVPNGIRHAWL
jgi:hypothetical protein